MKPKLPVFNRPKVLVVEDNPLVRQVSVGLLRLLNCEVLEANDAAAALAVVSAEGDLDLLFTDIVMPGDMNGFHLAEELKARHPHLKILFTSGYTREAMPVRSDMLPECQVLTKPYGLAQLSAALSKLMPEALAAAG